MAISNASNQIVKVNLIPGIIPSVLHLSQYDTGAGRPITFSVYDGGQAFTIPSDVSIAFEGTKPDGNGFSFTCSKSGSNALLTNYTNQMTALSGKIMCQLVFTDTSGGRVGSLPVLMVVTPAGINEDTVISDSDIEAIVAAQNQYAVLNARLDAAIDQMNTTTNKAIDQMNTTTNKAIDQMNTKANDLQNQYDVTNAKLDTAISAATQDSEVQDIRVRADGTSATTAGNAVREQITELKNNLTDNLNELGFLAKSFDKIAGSGHSSTKDKLNVNIKSGQKFYVTVSQTGSESDFNYQLFGWLNGTSTRILSTKTSSDRKELTASSDYEQLSIYIGNDTYSGAAKITLLFETEQSKINEINTLLGSGVMEFLKTPDIDFVDGYGVRYDTGVLVSDSSYSYCEIDVTLHVGATIKGYSGASDFLGVAFYDSNGGYISGFGNPVSGTYNWNISGIIPEGSYTAKIHCRKTHQDAFWIALGWNNATNIISTGLNNIQKNTEDIELINKKIANDVIIPILRNGSAGNPSNANSISTKYIYPIDLTKNKIVIEYLGDTSLADQYAWSYCTFVGATDGMESTAAFLDTSIQKRNYNQKATDRVTVPKFELPIANVADTDHIMFYLWRFKNDEVVPLGIATDQYNFRITYVEKNGVQNQRDVDFAETKHDLIYAQHAKGNTGTLLTLLHFSDLHADTSALARIMKDAEEIQYDDAICTGDMVSNTAVQISDWWDASVMTCIGNHECASYSSETGYNWTALSMANRDAYYIAPFESNWNIVHESGKSYFYKDYADAKIRMIVMDAMLYSAGEADTTLAQAQTSWLNALLSSAISSNLHVLIAIHAPHGGATAEECSFSRYGQGEMPTYNDCNTPQVVIDTVANAINNGLHFIGYIVGHTHQDNIWGAESNGTQLMYCITCAAVSNPNQWKNSDQYRDIENDAYNIVTIDTTNTFIKIIRGGGANMDDHMRTRKAICFNYSTGEKVGEVL